MKAYTSPVLSSTEFEAKVPVIDLAEEVKDSSVGQTVPTTESTLADFESIIIDQWKKDKFREPHIRLRGKLTSEELSELSQKIISVTKNWQANLTFEEYKAYKDSFKNCSWYQPSSIHILKDAYIKLKSAGLKWEFTIEFEAEDTETINFITQQLKSRRVRKLNLKQTFSEEQMDTILKACETAELERIHFANQTQHITDRQARILLQCFDSDHLYGVTGLPGNEISKETLGKLAVIAARNRIDMNIKECPVFNTRREIERSILYTYSPLETNSFRDYTPDDITRLGEALKTNYGQSKKQGEKSSQPELTLIINSKKLLDNQDDWVIFFNTLLDSNVNITELRIENPIINHEIMMAILAGLGTNKTIKILYVKTVPEEDHDKDYELNLKLLESLRSNTTLASIHLGKHYLFGSHIIAALAIHSTLTSLTLELFDLNYTRAGEYLKKLLTKTKTLRHLALQECTYDETIIAELAQGLEENNTLTSLTLSGLTNREMCILARAFSKNRSLTQFTFDSSVVDRSPLLTPEGLYKFVRILKTSHFLKKVNFMWPVEESKKKAGHQNLLKIIEAKNKEKWIREHRQSYVDTMIVLFQAARCGDRKHFMFYTPIFRDAILSYLRPSAYVATPKQIDRCTRLVQENMLEKLNTVTEQAVEQETKHENSNRKKWACNLFVTTTENEFLRKKTQTIEYKIFESWKYDEEKNTGIATSQDTQSAPETSSDQNLVNTQLDPRNAIGFEDFEVILNNYKSRSPLRWFRWCCFFHPIRSTAMRELLKIQPNAEELITRAQVERAISQDSQQRKDFFNDKADATQGDKGTDAVIAQLKQQFNF